MSDFYLLEFWGGPNAGQIWPYPVEETRPLPGVFHLGVDQYYVKTNAGENYCHYVFTPQHPLRLKSETING